jgi:hypothetical protein
MSELPPPQLSAVLCRWVVGMGLVGHSADITMTHRHKPFGVMETVKIKPQVNEHGGKLGTVVYEGREFGWPVVKVKFDGRPRPVVFSPEEVERG